MNTKRNSKLEKNRRKNNQRQAWELYVDGLSIPEISMRTKMSKSSISRYIREGLNEALEMSKSVKKERTLELERLNGMLSRWYPIARADQLLISEKGKDQRGKNIVKRDDFEAGSKAVMSVLKILERRAVVISDLVFDDDDDDDDDEENDNDDTYSDYNCYDKNELRPAISLTSAELAALEKKYREKAVREKILKLRDKFNNLPLPPDDENPEDNKQESTLT